MADEQNFESRDMLSWEYPERPNYQRGPIWYAMMLFAGLGLLIYAVYSGNFLFALIVIMFALVIYVTSIGNPAPVKFAITEDGLEIGAEFIRFRDVERFWFFYDPPVKILYIEIKGGFSGRRRVDLVDQDPNAIRDILGQFIVEDFEENEEPISDTFSRLLKL